MEIGGGGELAVSTPDGSLIGRIPAGVRARATVASRGVFLRFDRLTLGPMDALSISSEDTTDFVRVKGHPYRGAVDVFPGGAGVTVVNRLRMEQYLWSVVGSEMGRLAPNEESALFAQAIVSRSFALKALGRSRARGYDVVNTVSDQAYGGTQFESPQGGRAVGETRGLVVMYRGGVIDAFFHSTCGGRTADGNEVFGLGARPYLRSFEDRASDGQAYCAISPRYHWREEWSGDALVAALRETLPTTGVGSRKLTSIRDVQVTGRTASGRVASLLVRTSLASVPVNGPIIRQVLRPGDANMLRSNNFTVVATRGGGRITRLVAEGIGAGHGVGMCQWGAIGRARAGFSFQEIVSAYFPGTEIQRAY